MADEALARSGLHFDELNKIRVLEPEVAQQTKELKEECKEFVDKIVEFQKIVGTFIEMVDTVAKEVEKEKMKAIGSRNLLKSIAKQREAQQQQLQALITEKRMQLERLKKLMPEIKTLALFSSGARSPACSGPKVRPRHDVSVWDALKARLRLQHDALIKEEGGQNEFIEQLILQK